MTAEVVAGQVMSDPFVSELITVMERNRQNPGYASQVLPMKLQAAGGWCAPSKEIYDDWGFSDVAMGLLDLPSVSIRRGGIKWPTGPRARPLPKFEDCPSFGPPIGVLKPLELGIFI